MIRALRLHRTEILTACLLLSLFVFGCDAAPDEEDASSAAQDSGSANATAEDDSADPDAEETAEPADEAAPAKKKRRESSISVTASPVTLGDLVVPIVAEGTIRARHAAELKFEIGGRIEKVWVREGQRVRRGQKLATIDGREYQLAREEANSRYLQSLAQLAVEENGYQNPPTERSLSEQLEALKQLEREGTITRHERLDRELELGMAAVEHGAYRRELLEVRSGLSAARADMDRAELNIERTVVVAPFGGVVTGLELSAGERVQVGGDLCRLVDDINVEADVGVLESDLGSLEMGSRVLLTVPALQRTVEARVDVIRPDIDSDSRTCSVLMRVQSKDGKFKPGMFVRAAIAGEVRKDRLLVPREAILTRDNRPMLFRVEDDRAKWVYVQLGRRNDTLVEIDRIDQGGPLEPGALVVVDNHLTLTHDAKVKIKRRLEITDPWAAVQAESN